MNKDQVEILAKFFAEGIPKNDKHIHNVDSLSKTWSKVFDEEYYEKGTEYYKAHFLSNLAVLNRVFPKGEIIIKTSEKEFVIVESDGGIEITKTDLSNDPDHDISTSGYIPNVVHIL